MLKQLLGSLTLVALVLWVASATSQPPGGDKKKDGPPPGGPPPRYELGKVLPPFAYDQLNLTKKQRDELAQLEREVKKRLEKILTAEQKRKLETLRPPGPPGPGGPGGRPGGPPGDAPGQRPQGRSQAAPVDPPRGPVQNPRFTEAGPDAQTPAHYVLKGDVAWTVAGRADEVAGRGVALLSGRDGTGRRSGSVTQDVAGFTGGAGKWFRFSVRGLAEKDFAVEPDGLFLTVDFLGNQGTNPLDGVRRALDPLIKRDRQELAGNGNHRRDGGAVWKTYALDFRLPFAEIDTLRLGVGFRGGSASTAKESGFHVTEFALVAIPAPSDAPKIIRTARGPEPSLQRLIHLGGRWYYDPEPGMTAKPATLTITASNAHRLYYRDSRLTNPFAENMTAWLRAGSRDLTGQVVPQDRFVPDNVVLEFKDDQTLIVHARNIPNHPTAQFPEPVGRNPHYIQEHDRTYYLPINPVRNPKAVAMDATNSNRALPMGPIGIAINGVVFFNPFDAGMQDASNLMDRCCGHPNPQNLYHYHKYPVCVKSPFVDEGQEHSPLIGWAFDGFPIYGPYEAKGVMAKDSTSNPLNEFNLHYDDEHGWHYHVTPGKFPYLIGGYWGEPESRNLARPRRRS